MPQHSNDEDQRDELLRHKLLSTCSYNPAVSLSTPSARRAIPAAEFRLIYGGISNTTFYSLVSRGELAVHRIGRRTYVDSAEAERFWASCAQGRR